MALLGFWESLEGQQRNVAPVHPKGCLGGQQCWLTWGRGREDAALAAAAGG